MKKIKFLTLTLSALFAVNVNALDLNEAVDMALKNNLNVKSKNYDYLESVQNEKVAKSSFLPKVDVASSYSNTNEPNPNFESDNLTLTSKLSYNLFNGFKDMALKDSAKYLSNSSFFGLNATKQDIVLSTKIAYINYLDKQNALETYKSAYDLFQEQFNDSKNRFAQGLIAKNDLLQVQVNMSSAKQNVVKAQGDLKVAKYQLSNILGGVNLDKEEIKNLQDNNTKASNYDEKLLDNRSEILALTESIKSTQQLQKASKGGYYPKIDASVAHNNYYDNIKMDKYELGEEKQNIANVTASWNLYNGGYDEASTEIYKIKELKAKSLLEQTKLDIKLQYENAKSNLEVATDNLETAKLALTQAKENYAIVKNRFAEGVSTSTDLTDANYLLTQAKQGFNRAYFDKYLAISTLDRIFETNKY